MGSILTGVDEIAVFVQADDPDDGDGYATLELFGTDRSAALATVDCDGARPCTLRATLPVDAPLYVVPRAQQEDGDLLVGAPIWAAPAAAPQGR